MAAIVDRGLLAAATALPAVVDLALLAAVTDAVVAAALVVAASVAAATVTATVTAGVTAAAADGCCVLHCPALTLDWLLVPPSHLYMRQSRHMSFVVRAKERKIYPPSQ